MLILREAFQGTTRFEDFQRKLGISRNALTQRLRSLVADGVMEKGAPTAGRAQRAYGLTAKGKDLLPVVVTLRQWGERWLFEGRAPQTVLVDTGKNAPLPRIEVLAADGRVLRPRDIRQEECGEGGVERATHAKDGLTR